jgi:hypothetical protein
MTAFTPVSSIWVSALPLSQLEQTATSQGFYKNNYGDWKFKGNSMGAYFVSFKHLSLKKQQIGYDTILVGTQIENAKDQTGTPMTFEGIHILRITPSYIVCISLPFNFEIKAATRDAIIHDMIKLVESVHTTAIP